MRLFNLKKLTINKRTSTITVEHPDTERSIIIASQLEALSVLIGGYNEFGRKLDLGKFKDLEAKFWDIIEEVESEISN